MRRSPSGSRSGSSSPTGGHEPDSPQRHGAHRDLILCVLGVSVVQAHVLTEPSEQPFSCPHSSVDAFTSGTSPSIERRKPLSPASRPLARALALPHSSAAPREPESAPEPEPEALSSRRLVLRLFRSPHRPRVRCPETPASKSVRRTRCRVFLLALEGRSAACVGR